MRTPSYFTQLLPFYGVPKRIAQTLARHNSELPDPYAPSCTPSSLPNEERPWVYLYGPTGTGKSTRAAHLLALYLRGRGRLGYAESALEQTNPDSQFYRKDYVPRGATPAYGKTFYHYIRVTELLRQMKSDFGSDGRAGALLFECCLTADFLVLDDLTGSMSAWELSQLDLLIDRRYGDGSYTIITSNHPISRLGKAIGSERIQSRIGEIAKQRKLGTTYR